MNHRTHIMASWDLLSLVGGFSKRFTIVNIGERECHVVVGGYASVPKLLFYSIALMRTYI